MNLSKEILPGWTFIEESIDDSKVMVSATNTLNYKVEKINTVSAIAYEDCLNEAFKIEQSVGKNRNKLFFNILNNLINEKLIKIKKYNESAMGSWYIETNNQRVVLDGKDMTMWIAEKEKKWFKSEWNTKEVFEHLESLQYNDLKEISNKLNNYHQQ